MDIRDGVLEIFNVDHGACALLSMPSGKPGVHHHVLIDCGHSTDYNGAPWYPGNQLRIRGITHVDLLVCTNYDEDHASGAPSLKGQGISVGCILGNPTVPPEVIEHLKTEDGMGNGIKLIATSLAERRQAGAVQTPPSIPGVSLRWFWNPWPHWDTENNLSLVAHLSVGGVNFLFPGDMEKDGFSNLLNFQSFAALLPGIHVLMASHHGRENGKCEAMFDTYGCRPELVIISDCAKRHQSQETVPFYYAKAKGIQGFRSDGGRSVLTTRSDGHIWFRWEGGRCNVY